MKHIFIINPIAGRKKKSEKFINNIIQTSESLGIDYQLYFTKGRGDGGKFARECCIKYSDENVPLRIYGCGGDGTVNELANGTYGYDNVEIGIIPMGTGNDYIRNYGTVKEFRNIRNQILGKSQYSDLIRYKAYCNNDVIEAYCANMFNIGFDCNVADLTETVKQLPLIKGPMAYLISVAIILIKKKGANLKIEFEDGRVKDGKLLLTSIANGCYCGGGVKGAPYSKLDDGLMDVTVIEDISRMFFISMFPSYSKGTHLEKKKVKEGGMIKCTKEKTLTITARDEYLKLCTDGEISIHEKLEFSMVSEGFRFIVPATT